MVTQLNELHAAADNMVTTAAESVHQLVEDGRIAVRNVRREGNSQLKEFLKEKEISEDEERQGEEEIQKLTDLFVEKVDIALGAKEKDLLDF